MRRLRPRWRLWWPWWLAGWLALPAAAEVPSTSVSTPSRPALPTDAPGWRAWAKADLAAVRDHLLAAHPGAIHPADPHFKDWLERGYREALALEPLVVDQISALSLLQYYVQGFDDGHLSLDAPTLGEPPLHTHGIAVRWTRGDYRVHATLPNWPTALPPVGARLLDCDGESASTLMARRFGPYAGRREVASAKEAQAVLFSWGLHEGLRLASCRFKLPGQAVQTFPLRYQAIAESQAAALRGLQPSTSGMNRWHEDRGVLWIQAGNFMLNVHDARALDTMVHELAAYAGSPTAIVFDLRGNRGGDSAIGARLFETVTGGLTWASSVDDTARLPMATAQWRVSHLAVATWRSHEQRIAKLEGEHSERLRWAREFRARMEAAQKAGAAWVEQPGFAVMTRGWLAVRQARLKRFAQARLVVLTDPYCMSACLDTVDLLTQVPGSLHMGASTGADTVYMDIGPAALPSGHTLWVPLKVWHGRLRGHNVPVHPDIVLDDWHDDRVVEAALRQLVSDEASLQGQAPWQ